MARRAVIDEVQMDVAKRAIFARAPHASREGCKAAFECPRVGAVRDDRDREAGGRQKTNRLTLFVPESPFALQLQVPLFASLSVSVPVPTATSVT